MVSEMTKKKNVSVSVSKKADGDGVDIAGLETPQVEVFPKIAEESKVEVKQAFSEPAPPNNAELVEAVNSLPEANLTPTPRWYGETFLPQYIQAKNRLKRLAGIQ